MAKEETMVVVAKERGTYGTTIRVPGERFAITKKQHFSKRWMFDTKDKDAAEEIRILERAYKATQGDRARDVSDEQLEAEVAEAGGALQALRAENKRLKAQIKKLEEAANLADAEKSNGSSTRKEAKQAAEDSEGASDGAGDAGEAGAGKGDEGGGDAVGDGGDTSSAKPARRTSSARRRRN